MMSEVDNGVYLAVFKRANNMAKNGNPPKSEINWNTLKTDLQRLSAPQLKLVFELVEHMRNLNVKIAEEQNLVLLKVNLKMVKD